jgi:hypothetical protein
MSSISPSTNDRPDIVESHVASDHLSATADRLADAQPLQSTALLPLRALGFWAAVVLPFVVLTLAATGYAAENAATFSLLLCANVVGLVLGRDYNAE